MCGSVVEIIQLTPVTLVAHEALATVAGAVTVALHGNGAHGVTITGWGKGQRTTEREPRGDREGSGGPGTDVYS